MILLEISFGFFGPQNNNAKTYACFPFSLCQVLEAKLSQVGTKNPIKIDLKRHPKTDAQNVALWQASWAPLGGFLVRLEPWDASGGTRAQPPPSSLL
jgi:hypothetical protein